MKKRIVATKIREKKITRREITDPRMAPRLLRGSVATPEIDNQESTAKVCHIYLSKMLELW